MRLSNRPLSVRRAVGAALIAPLMLLAGCGDGGTDALEGGSNGGGGGSEVTLAGQNYTEMQIMTEMYAALLEDAGYEANVKYVETRDLYGPGLKDGSVDVVAEYLSSMTEYLNKQVNGPDAEPVASPDVQATVDTLTSLGEKYGVTPLEPAEAEDANAFAVTDEFSQEFDVTTLSDLGEYGKPVDLAAAPDCPERSDCKLGLEKVYGIEIGNFVPLGFGTTQTKEALTSGEVQLGQVGTTDASLEQRGLTLLEDDKNWQNAENLVPVVNTEFLDANPEVADILNELSGVLTTEDLAQLNAQVDVERMLPKDVATAYLEEKGLIGG